MREKNLNEAGLRRNAGNKSKWGRIHENNGEKSKWNKIHKWVHKKDSDEMKFKKKCSKTPQMWSNKMKFKHEKKQSSVSFELNKINTWVIIIII